MDNKTRASKVYIEVNLNNAGNEVKNKLQWGEESTTIELLHIATMESGIYYYRTSPHS